MPLSPKPLLPRYGGDEILLGAACAALLHLAFLGPLVARTIRGETTPADDDQPLVARPVVQARLLKLGKPIDRSRLPDRLVPRARTAKHQDIHASQDSAQQRADAGAPPPPNTQDSDLQNLIAKSDPFAEDAGAARPEEGHELGVDGGTETDPAKVRAGDMYAAALGKFFHERWQYPTVISQGEASRLCVVMRVNLSPRMVVWHVRQEPVKRSGNDLFDDSARTMLQKLLDTRAPLPEPPAEVGEMYKGRTVDILLAGDTQGDTTRCK